jgi:hypothetical protein
MARASFSNDRTERTSNWAPNLARPDGPFTPRSSITKPEESSPAEPFGAIVAPAYLLLIPLLWLSAVLAGIIRGLRDLRRPPNAF